MKRTVLLLTVISLMAACGGQTTEPAEIVTENLPLGAEQIPFEDNPDLVLVIVKNNQGTMTAKGTYFKGLRHGSWTEFHTTGVVSAVSHYDLGVQEGLSLTVDNNGQLLSSEYYHNGKRNGTRLEYNRARVISEKNYIDDKLEGIVRNYYPSGVLMEEAEYENGERHGSSVWYDMNGQISIEYIYEQGKLVKQ